MEFYYREVNFIQTIWEMIFHKKDDGIMEEKIQGLGF